MRQKDFHRGLHQFEKPPPTLWRRMEELLKYAPSQPPRWSCGLSCPKYFIMVG